ncbi:cation diffusion facilitator family transporter [Chloroflexota bacterium]
MFSTNTGAAKLALAVVIGLVVFKAVVAYITGSISITAQAVDSFLDLFAISVSVFAINMASKPADEEHHFGHGKVECIAAVVQAVLIFAAAGGIIYSAIRRIITGSVVELTEAGIGVMLVSILASIFLSRHLLKVARNTDSMALEASARNITADVYSASGVLVALIIIRFTGFGMLDPIVALGVSVFLLKAAYDVLKKAFGELLDTRLPEAEETELRSCIEEHINQLAGFHEVRTRKAGSQRFIDLHLLLPKNASLEEAHQMCDHLEEDIENRLSNSNVTIHVEPCNIECDQCQISSCGLRIDITLGSNISSDRGVS